MTAPLHRQDSTNFPKQLQGFATVPDPPAAIYLLLSRGPRFDLNRPMREALLSFAGSSRVTWSVMLLCAKRRAVQLCTSMMNEFGVVEGAEIRKTPDLALWIRKLTICDGVGVSFRASGAVITSVGARLIRCRVRKRQLPTTTTAYSFLYHSSHPNFEEESPRALKCSPWGPYAPLSIIPTTLLLHECESFTVMSTSTRAYSVDRLFDNHILCKESMYHIR